jgi:hypothetical protein
VGERPSRCYRFDDATTPFVTKDGHDMRRLLLAVIVFLMASFGAVGTAFAQYGPTPSSVAPASSVPGGAGTGTATSGGAGGGGLAFTGSDLIELLLRVGIVLVAVGGLVLLFSRRRRFRTVGG